ncbi:putative Mg2+ transporter-C (MgtC) family protein [Paenibacillus sp. V4I3]|uniref:MgtC/SapB family protein n=1 Tax=unclassified Paenibacillus TaxID=185978 RepID=UPI00278392FE|nr:MULTISPECIES: MgtC/SapB family protein [unclassified Paenibacillus]MDQ0878691.1 putative Mg2+ transporter-C (MgtC) family protein [Paenibacillus sp. V4I3]MDQ0885452.1 putative Mg2+ transporter-C (MgtC) family protein [Paenibacillus sp. V4I9]
MDSIWHISYWELTLRIFAAATMGGVIGFEREWSNHAAGLRTHILVCIGSAAIMLLSIYGFNQFVDETNVRIDPARLAAQVITGIGFLGAGAIMRNGSTVSGLTTAASIWVVAAIGLCVGAGFFYCAILATFMVLVSLFVLNKWEKHVFRFRKNQDVVIRIHDRMGTLDKISTLFVEQGIQVINVKLKPDNSGQNAYGVGSIIELTFSVKMNNIEKLNRAIENISKTGDVLSLESHHWNLHKTMEPEKSQAV